MKRFLRTQKHTGYVFAFGTGWGVGFFFFKCGEARIPAAS